MRYHSFVCSVSITVALCRCVTVRLWDSLYRFDDRSLSLSHTLCSTLTLTLTLSLSHSFSVSLCLNSVSDSVLLTVHCTHTHRTRSPPALSVSSVRPPVRPSRSSLRFRSVPFVPFRSPVPFAFIRSIDRSIVRTISISHSIPCPFRVRRMRMLIHTKQSRSVHFVRSFIRSFIHSCISFVRSFAFAFRPTNERTNKRSNIKQSKV